MTSGVGRLPTRPAGGEVEQSSRVVIAGARSVPGGPQEPGWAWAAPMATIGEVGVVAPGPGSSVSATRTPDAVVPCAWSVPAPLSPTANPPMGCGAFLPTINHAS